MVQNSLARARGGRKTVIRIRLGGAYARNNTDDQYITLHLN